jgi:hypothetical protein
MWDPHQLEHSGAVVVVVVVVVVDPGIHVVSPPIRIEDRPHVHRNDRIIQRHNNNVVASAVERTIMSMVDSILLVLVMLGVYQL